VGSFVHMRRSDCRSPLKSLKSNEFCQVCYWIGLDEQIKSEKKEKVNSTGMPIPKRLVKRSNRVTTELSFRSINDIILYAYPFCGLGFDFGAAKKKLGSPNSFRRYDKCNMPPYIQKHGILYCRGAKIYFPIFLRHVILESMREKCKIYYKL
jgi:hypothetical protein